MKAVILRFDAISFLQLLLISLYLLNEAKSSVFVFWDDFIKLLFLARENQMNALGLEKLRRKIFNKISVVLNGYFWVSLRNEIVKL